MSVLVLADHNNTQLSKETLSTVTAASQLKGEVSILVAGYECNEVVNEAKHIEGVTTVFVADTPNYQYQQAEVMAQLLADFGAGFLYVLANASASGKNILPRAAGLLDMQPLADIIAIESDDTFLRPTYAGNIVSKIQSLDDIKLMTVRSTAFDKAPIHTEACTVVELAQAFSYDTSVFIDCELTQSERPELGSASIVISGGRALSSAENFSMIFDLADSMDAAVGASRAAVDAGYVSNDLQVGQTGKIVAPNLYIAAGISGAVQHIAGMKDSKYIVAINKDPEAPIFDIADYGLVADIFNVVPEMISLMQET